MFGFLAISAVIFVVGFLIIDVSPLDWPVDSLMLPVTAAAVACQLQNYLRRYLFVNSRPRTAFVNDIFRYGFQIVIVFVLVPKLGLKTPGCYWIITGCAVLATAHGFLSIGNMRWDRAIFREALERNWHFSKWLVTSEMLRWATVQLYITMAGVYLGAAAVGSLRAAQNILGVCNIFMLAMENFAPAQAAVRYRENGMDGLRRYLNKLFVLGMLIVGGVALVASVAPEFWFTLIYGAEHTGQGYIVQCWALFFCINYLNYPVGIALRTIERTAAIFKVFLISATVSVITVVPLTKFLGIPGTLIGVIAMVALRYLLLSAGFRRARRELGDSGETPST
jgi:O-antigen/teichoic acid export membrane protein